MRSAAWLLILSATSIAWAQSPDGGQPGESADQSVLTLHQEVRNVVIDVIATDKHGQPVHGLDKTHFQVLENGVAQPIAYFDEHRMNAPGKPPAMRRTDLPADVHSNVSAVPGEGALMVILLDALNTPVSSQSYVRAQVMEYLKGIPAGTTMAIFTLGDRLEMIQGFTSDPALLKAALDGKSYPAVPATSMLNSSASRSTDSTSGSLIPFGSSVNAIRSSLERFGNASLDAGAELRVRYTLDAFNALGTYLSGIPGRKNLVWFSSSVPWNINPDFSLVTDPTGRVDYSEEMKRLADLMTVGRIAVYPIDAHALATPPGYGADKESANFGVRGNGGAFGRQEMNSQMFMAGNHQSMENLAAATGGRAQFNTNGLGAAVLKVQNSGENFYTIAYSPTDKKYDGEYRQLSIRVTDPGIKLEYRRGYFADDPARATNKALRMSMSPLRAVMQRGAPDATQIPFRLQTKQAAVQPSPDRPTDRLGEMGASLTGPLVRYEFHWVVDLSGVTFTVEDGVHRAELDTVLDVYDVDGKILNNIYATLPLSLTDAQYSRYRTSGLPMKQVLDVPAGLVYLRAAVVDPATGHTGATEFPLAARLQKDVAQSGESRDKATRP